MARTGLLTPVRALAGFLAAGFCAMGILGGCHGVLFGDKTSQRDRDLNNFAEARSRAATYYDGKDYVRAALQYKEALKYRPKHVSTRLGYAYSLTYSNVPSNLMIAEQEFKAMGKLKKVQNEVKRTYGMGLNARGLAVQYDRRARMKSKRGLQDESQRDQKASHKKAEAGLRYFGQVIEFDRTLAGKKILAPMRVSASLTPDAHVGMAHCEILLAKFDPEHPAELSRHLSRARAHILKFAKVAEQARRFWKKRRERLLVTDPLHEEGSPGAKTIDPREANRYSARIFSTIRQESEIRTALLLTLLYVNRYRDGIDEATTILELDPERHEVLMLRGNAYAYLKPPNYKKAVRDLKAYRKTRDLTRLTEDLITVNLRIKRFEDLEKKQAKKRAG